MEQLLTSVQQSLQARLDKRKEEGLYRSLQCQEGLIDFCSNDYLSFARTATIRHNAEQDGHPEPGGSTGSRSISGNSRFAEELESKIAAFHGAEAGLLFNSGYDANLGLFSCLAQKGDTLICDELIHASIIDGCRLSQATRFRFAHNNLEELEKKLKIASGRVFVAVESVYSMDGDMAPLLEIAALCESYHASLIVDEAHATGVFGPNGKGLVCQLGLESQVLARIHTFGKAIGSHGAIVLGSSVLRNYLINFARSFIFTTALPKHALLQIAAAYEQLATAQLDRSPLFSLIDEFRKNFAVHRPEVFLIDSKSPIQSVVIPGNERARAASRYLQQKGFDVRAILSPSVPKGKERLRISLHLHNTHEQVTRLQQELLNFLS